MGEPEPDRTPSVPSCDVINGRPDERRRNTARTSIRSSASTMATATACFNLASSRLTLDQAREWYAISSAILTQRASRKERGHMSCTSTRICSHPRAFGRVLACTCACAYECVYVWACGWMCVWPGG
eukprot:6180507-Pleurochrysis_carterae.AAC.1